MHNKENKEILDNDRFNQNLRCLKDILSLRMCSFGNMTLAEGPYVYKELPNVTVIEAGMMRVAEIYGKEKMRTMQATYFSALTPEFVEQLIRRAEANDNRSEFSALDVILPNQKSMRET